MAASIKPVVHAGVCDSIVCCSMLLGIDKASTGFWPWRAASFSIGFGLRPGTAVCLCSVNSSLWPGTARLCIALIRYCLIVGACHGQLLSCNICRAVNVHVCLIVCAVWLHELRCTGQVSQVQGCVVVTVRLQWGCDFFIISPILLLCMGCMAVVGVQNSCTAEVAVSAD